MQKFGMTPLVRHLICACLLTTLCLSSCDLPLVEPSTANNGGATVWIEYPAQGSTLPNQTLTFTIYATDLGVSDMIPVSGITSITLWVNGSSLGSFQPVSISGDDGQRLMRLDQPWQPPAEGNYVLNAQAVTARGDASNTASVTFCVGACQPADAAPPTPTSTQAPLQELTTVPTPAVQFWASPPTVNAGECTRVYWEVSNASQVLLDNMMKPLSGSDRYCACEPYDVILTVADLNNQSQDYPLTINVTGTCTFPTVTPTEAPPADDTTGPMFVSGQLVWEDCKFYGQADFYDPSGVSWGEFHYSLNGQPWAWILMNDTGSGWRSQVGVSVTDGIGTPIGTVQFKFRTLDSLNNETWSPVSEYNYMSCSG